MQKAYFSRDQSARRGSPVVPPIAGIVVSIDPAQAAPRSECGNAFTSRASSPMLIATSTGSDWGWARESTGWAVAIGEAEECRGAVW